MNEKNDIEGVVTNHLAKRFDWVKVEDAVRMNMTNSEARQTLKTGFINNNAYIYDQMVVTDYVKLVKDDFVITTTLDYTTATYLVLKLQTTELAFVVADYLDLFANVGGKLVITLPIINEIQQAVPETGTWKVSLCNGREAQRQSLSKALRPKADL